MLDNSLSYQQSATSGTEPSGSDSRRRRRWDDATPRDAPPADTKRLRPEQAADDDEPKSAPPTDTIPEEPAKTNGRDYDNDANSYRRNETDVPLAHRDDTARRDDTRRPEGGRGDRHPEDRPGDKRHSFRDLPDDRANLDKPDHDDRRRFENDGRYREHDDRRWRDDRDDRRYRDDRRRKDDVDRRRYDDFDDNRRRRNDYDDRRRKDDYRREDVDDRRREDYDTRRRDPGDDRRRDDNRRDDIEDRRRDDSRVDDDREDRRRRELDDTRRDDGRRKVQDDVINRQHFRGDGDDRRRNRESGELGRTAEDDHRDRHRGFEGRDRDYGHDAGRRREDLERRRLHDSDDDEKHHKDESREAEIARKQYQSTRAPTKECAFCFGGPLFNDIRERHVLMVMQGAYMAAQTAKDALLPYHAMISPSEHYSCSAELDDDILEDIRDLKKYYRLFLKSLPSKRPLSDCGYRSEGPFKPIFVEWYLPRGGQPDDWMVAAKRNLSKSSSNEPHFSIDCLCLGAQDFEEAKMAFAYEFENCGDTVNRVNKPYTKHPSNVQIKKLVRASNPPPYIYVDFGLGEAFLHTMESKESFNRKTVRKILSTLYGADAGVDEETFDYDKFVSYFKRKFDEAFPL